MRTETLSIAHPLHGVHDADDAGARGDTRGLLKWLIIAAAVFGALAFARTLRRIAGLAFVVVWVWFWTHGGWRHVF